MKSVAIFAIALACVLGLASAQYGYYPQTQASSGGFGSGGFLALIGLLVLLFALFGFNSSGNGDTTIIYANMSGTQGR